MEDNGLITIYCEKTGFEYTAKVIKVTPNRIRVYLDDADIMFWLKKDNDRYIGEKLGLVFCTRNCVIV